MTTPDPDPSCLRILTLTRFSETEWSRATGTSPPDHTAQGACRHRPVGRAVARHEVPHDVTILLAFSSWLPTQAPISRIDADGDWRYDDQTMDFLAVPTT